jgi:hypothetical protein
MGSRQHYNCLQIPPFMENGNLPPGIHVASLGDIERRFTQTPHRKSLFDGLVRLAIHLKEAGCKTLYLDGSYVTRKETPADYDAVWDPTGVSAKIDPDLLRRNKLPERKQRYLGDVFVHVPEFGGFDHLKEFQLDKGDRSPKGIIKIDLRKPI